ncbi:MAG: glutamate formimidoyltransferase [Chloroflexi bacterium]|nr:glutamate formimidoyltransferase [Chloroflexota bacterium]
MRRIVECVPNFSEGRRREILDQITAEITAVPGAVLLDVEMNADHNRAVVTFIGPPEAVEEAAFRAVRGAAQVINLDQHRGEHPRIGATDVVPLVPISGVSMEECVELAQRLGERIGRELEIPVYLYEKAATRSERSDLAYIRRGEYEALKEEIASHPDREPDFGPRRVGAAGATAVGAREPLIAYNIYLDTRDIEIAKAVAKAVRNSSGGLRYVKALGMEIAERGLVQVSMNMTDYRQTPLHRAFGLVKLEAQRYGVNIVSSEIVGLVPEDALLESAEFYLQLENYRPAQILERKIAEARAEVEPTPPLELAAQTQVEVPSPVAVPQTTPAAGVDSFLEAISMPTPTPGGGSAAALAGAVAAALAGMVSRLTLNKEEFKEVQQEISQLAEATDTLRQDLSALIQEDADAYQAVLAAYRLPKDTPEEQERRQVAIQAALRVAASVPLSVAERAVRTLEAIRTLAEKGYPRAASDAGTAAYLAQAAVKAAGANVLANVVDLSDQDLARVFQEELAFFEGRADDLVSHIESLVASKLQPPEPTASSS